MRFSSQLLSCAKTGELFKSLKLKSDAVLQILLSKTGSSGRSSGRKIMARIIPGVDYIAWGQNLMRAVAPKESSTNYPNTN